jgi:hypothetical protein
MKKVLLLIAILGVFELSTVSAQQNATRTEFNKILSSYFDTKNSLANDIVNSTGAGARSMLRSLKTFPVEKLSTTQQSDWNTLAAELKKFAEPMLIDRDLKTLRKSF